MSIRALRAVVAQLDGNTTAATAAATPPHAQLDGSTGGNTAAAVSSGHGDEYEMRGRKIWRDLSPEGASTVRVLREAAIVQHAVELPQVGSQRAQFSPGLQAMVELVSLLDCGPSQDVSGMSRHELIRAIEAVDGPPGTALCKALLEGNEEKVAWCLCRGAKADVACADRCKFSKLSSTASLSFDL